MKKILLITGAAYGIYMLVKKIMATSDLGNLATEGVDTRGGFADGGQTRKSVKAHANNGNIRGFMKKAHTISHHLEEATDHAEN
jgi:hypothetical protein